MNARKVIPLFCAGYLTLKATRRRRGEMAQGKRRWRFLVSEAKTHLGSLPQRTKFGANEPREHQGDQQHPWTSTMPEDPLMRCWSHSIQI
ncbi:hypothetical protein RR46_06837 [Papilio xuthus]|uniref:Uncharacterized protein n=1 Tax=Papilio xuthus TaxID=66420 RepID=A0A194PT10_PAPXU|nr:hypothetical protein RR46_06837 [Papilio xuthus]